jgi:hypothetical protein
MSGWLFFKGEDSNWHISSCQARQVIFISHYFNENCLSLVSYRRVKSPGHNVTTWHCVLSLSVYSRAGWCDGNAVHSYLEVLVRMSVTTLPLLKWFYFASSHFQRENPGWYLRCTATDIFQSLCNLSLINPTFWYLQSLITNHIRHCSFIV